MAPRSAKKVKTSASVPLKDKQDENSGPIPVPEFLLVPDKFDSDSEEESGSEDADSDTEDSEGETSDNSDNPSSSTSAKRKRARELQKLLDRKKKERRKRTTTSPLESPAHSDEESDDNKSITVGNKQSQKPTKRKFDKLKSNRDKNQKRTAENKNLLDVITRFPCIYDTSDPLYSDTKEQRRVWKEIAKETELKDPCRRFSNLKISYQRIMEKMNRDPTYESFRFPHVAQLQFLEAKSGGSLRRKVDFEKRIILHRRNSPGRHAEKLKKSLAKREIIKKNLKLLETIKEHPLCYDSSLRNGKSSWELSEEWKKVSKITGVINPARAFSNLKVSYERIQKKLLAGQVVMVRFPYMEQMQFFHGSVEKWGSLNKKDSQDWPIENFSDSSLSSLDWWEEEEDGESVVCSIKEERDDDDESESVTSINVNTVLKGEKEEENKSSKDVMKNLKSKSKGTRYRKLFGKALEDAKLLNVIKRYPCLYEPLEQSSLGKSDRQKIWSEIKEETGLEDPARRFSNLKITYNRIKKRFIEEGDDTTIRFAHFQRMQFLDGQSGMWPEDEEGMESQDVSMDAQSSIDVNEEYREDRSVVSRDECDPLTPMEVCEVVVAKEESHPDYKALSHTMIDKFFKAMTNTGEEKVLHEFIGAAIQGKVYEIMAKRNQ